MSEGTKDTRPFLTNKSDTDSLSPEKEQKVPTLAQQWSVRFKIENKEILFKIGMSEELIIGRSDDDYQPDIDLAPFGALERGVSRQHAQVSASSDYLLITDLGSTNGTRLNSHKLRANEPYRLDHGDMVSVSGLEFIAEFTMVPIHEGLTLERSGTGSQTAIDDEEAQEIASRPILIVEDDVSVSQLLADVLDMMNYKSHQVHNVTQAMRYIATNLPRAVLLDLRMPDFNGIEVCQMLRQDLGTRHLPIFVISGASDEEEIKAVLAAGADVFLSKPVGINELIDAVNKYVGSA